MNIINNLYCLILAGGKGRRLWPESVVDMPKQFIDFFGTGRTQLQQTYDRFRRFLPSDHIFISTNVSYKDIVAGQLPELPQDNILAEPIWRNTGPSIAWGAFRMNRLNNDSIIIVAPSDHHVINEDAFKRNVLKGAEFAAVNNTILTMGVVPTRPEPGYGYIQFKGRVEEGIYSIRSFTEKPDREFAKVFLESGEFFWNTGMFMSSTRNLLNCMRILLPPRFNTLSEKRESLSIEAENEYIKEYFPLCPNVSMEQGIIEKTPDVNVMKCDFGWADLGTWHAIYEAERCNDGDNVVLDSDVILDNAHGNIIKIDKGRLAVINGLNGYIVVEKGNTLLICPREDSSALIRKYSAEVENR